MSFALKADASLYVCSVYLVRNTSLGCSYLHIIVILGTWVVPLLSNSVTKATYS